jgi:hypothetical protein
MLDVTDKEWRNQLEQQQHQYRPARRRVPSDRTDDVVQEVLLTV